MTGDPLPFTHEMVIIHKVFRREFGQGSSWVRRVQPGDTAAAARVYGHLEKIFDMLHHHHEAEDINLWPILRARAANQQELLDDMEAQHGGIDPALAKAKELGQQWAANADPAAREAFAHCLEEVKGPLLAHLDQEEAQILPLAQQHLSEEEWGQLAQHVLANTPKQDLIKGFGGVLEDATPQERTMMLKVVPAVPKLLYQAFGKRSYINEAKAVRGVAPVGL